MDNLDTCAAGRLFSALGRRMYFPKGIIAQSSEAKGAKLANATIGMAVKEGSPLVLPVLRDSFAALTAEKAVVYAPTAGLEELRQAWRANLLAKNPSIDPSCMSLPLVVPGITAGISISADLFLDQGQGIIMPSPAWDNYSLIFGERRAANLLPAVYIKPGPGLDLQVLEEVVAAQAQSGQVRIILNFPNNPTGYTPSEAEGAAIVDMLRRAAENGADVLALIDDAYFGFFYEDGLLKESLFAALCSAHERIVAVKLDGPTKEDYSWGLRAAFLTFGWKGMDKASEELVTRKIMGLIRSSVSCSNTPAQLLTLQILKDPRSDEAKRAYFSLLKSRYQTIKDIIADAPPSPALEPLPFNSGYFMSFLCKGIDAELLRQELLQNHGVGVIALENYIRVAYSSIDKEKIAPVFNLIYQTANGMNGLK